MSSLTLFVGGVFFIVIMAVVAIFATPIFSSVENESAIAASAGLIDNTTNREQIDSANDVIIFGLTMYQVVVFFVMILLVIAAILIFVDI